MATESDCYSHRFPEELRPIAIPAMRRFRFGALSIHGPSHWFKVFHHATFLCAATPKAALTVCQLFALLHDCERRNEGHDPQHGPRAADLAAELHRQSVLKITDAQLKLLCEACIGHDTGQVSDDPTVGVCWDADRLDLPRVGIRVDAKYLSTAAARKLIR